MQSMIFYLWDDEVWRRSSNDAGSADVSRVGDGQQHDVASSLNLRFSLKKTSFRKFRFVSLSTGKRWDVRLDFVRQFKTELV
jgi:hypothetical protein